MALARLIEGDVYIFYGSGGEILCFCCHFMPLVEIRHSPFKALNGVKINKDYVTNSRTAMLEHLKKHRDSGDRVPCRAFETLEDDLKLFGDDTGVFEKEIEGN